MGAWGEGIFENDDAADFTADTLETANLSRVQEALDAVLRANFDLELPTANEGLAAADIIARLYGQPGPVDQYTEAIDKWGDRVKLFSDKEILEKARTVVDRVRTEPSELLELWSEVDATCWLAILDALMQRLLRAEMVN